MNREILRIQKWFHNDNTVIFIMNQNIITFENLIYS